MSEEKGINKERREKNSTNKTKVSSHPFINPGDSVLKAAVQTMEGNELLLAILSIQNSLEILLHPKPIVKIRNVCSCFRYMTIISSQSVRS